MANELIQLAERLRAEAQRVELLAQQADQGGDLVGRLCDLVGITKEMLAAGVVITTPGITVTDLARRLKVHRRTIYTWPRICRALRVGALHAGQHTSDEINDDEIDM